MITTSFFILFPKYFLIMFSLKWHYQLLSFKQLDYDVHYDAYDDVMKFKKNKMAARSHSTADWNEYC